MFKPRKTALAVAVVVLLSHRAAAEPLPEIQPARRISTFAEDSPASRIRGAVLSSIALHPDGRIAAAAGDDHAVKLLDLQTGRPIRRLAGHNDWVRSVDFSQDGSRLASAGDDRRILVWNTSDWSRPRQLATFPGRVAAVKFAADDRRLVVAGFCKEVWILDVGSGEVVQTIKAGCHDIRAVAISSRGRLFATAARNGRVRVYDLQQGKLRWQSDAHRRPLHSVAFSPDERAVASCGAGGRLILHDAGGQEAGRIEVGGVKLLSVAFAGRNHIAVGGSDNRIRIYDVNTRRATAELVGHSGSVTCLAATAGTLLSGSYDTTLCVWDLDQRKVRRTDERNTSSRYGN